MTAPLRRPRWLSALTLLFALAVSSTGVDLRGQAADRDGIRELLLQLERALQTGGADAYLALVSGAADETRARSFADSEILPGATRVVVQERDRASLQGVSAGNGFRLVLDVFVEFGARARALTWRLDVARWDDTEPWQITDEERLTGVENLYRLSLNPTRQFDARALTITSEDLELTLAEGSVFVADTDQGVTGAVLLGRGNMRFHPKPDTEKGQVKIFSGSETLETSFDAAFIRISPSDFDARIAAAQLTDRAVDPRVFRRADEVFREEAAKSFSLDLADLSRDTWWLLPASGDFLAEVRTRRYDTLTYTRSASQPEDITLFDRKRRRNISVYASAQKLAQRGRFYDEDELADYDVLDYDIDLAVTPERRWLQGRASLRLKVRSSAISSITLRLADPLVVRSVVSDRFGRLFGIHVNNQNAIAINLPTLVPRDTELTLTVAYSGRLEPQSADRETLGPQRGQKPGFDEPSDDPSVTSAEPSFLYSSRSYWYPQAQVTDYATATIRLAVPSAFDCIASGSLSGSPASGKDAEEGRKVYVFTAAQPLRYLAFILSRFVRTDTANVLLPGRPADPESVAMEGPSYDVLNVAVEANPRLVDRGHDMAVRIADIAQFYSSLVGDGPFPSFTLALVEGDRPGGHSPGYFAALKEPLPASSPAWRDDPEVFDNYPEFYLAHELAHQWWGQAVGWRNYHEQWLSEGFAQYFAALYAQHHRGNERFAGVLRQLRKWGMDDSSEGPIYLGYRLGHIRGETRVFNAVVYNKSAAVLHMLRRLIGDEAFFGGMRRFYRSSRFRKAGTEDLRLAMEAESKRPLDRFFERWIYGSTLPSLKFSYHVDQGDVVLHVEQVGEIFDVPLTVRLQYADKKVDVLVPVSERVTDMRVPLDGTLRGAEIGRDDGTMANVLKN